MSTQDAKAAAAQAREKLAENLDAIEDKLNVPKRVGELSKRVSVAYDENRTPFIVAAGAAVAVVGGLIAWAVLSDD